MRAAFKAYWKSSILIVFLRVFHDTEKMRMKPTSFFTVFYAQRKIGVLMLYVFYQGFRAAQKMEVAFASFL